MTRSAIGQKRVEEAITVGFKESGQILILTGVGGSLAATVAAAGLGDILGGFFSASTVAPLLVVWAIAAVLHIAVGSVTLSAITAAGLLAPIAPAIGLDPVLLALAAGAGSLFMVHVTSNTFWLLQSLLGQSVRGALKSVTVGRLGGLRRRDPADPAHEPAVLTERRPHHERRHERRKPMTQTRIAPAGGRPRPGTRQLHRRAHGRAGCLPISAPRSSRWSGPEPATSCATGACTRAIRPCCTAPSTATRSPWCWTSAPKPASRPCSRWSRKSDILLENFRPGTLEKWGLGPEVLNEANPDLIITRISAFGQTGPLSERPGFAAVAEAYGGFRNLVGDPDRPPVRVGVSIGDSIAGLYAAFGSMMSLYQREARRRDAAGAVPLTERIIDVALNEAMFSMMESLIPDYQAYGVDRQRVGGRMEGIAPSNAYFCKDGASIVVAGNGDSIFQRYMETIGRPDLGRGSGTANQCRPLGPP